MKLARIDASNLYHLHSKFITACNIRTSENLLPRTRVNRGKKKRGPRLLETPTLSAWLISTAAEGEWGTAPEGEEEEAQEAQTTAAAEEAQTTAAAAAEEAQTPEERQSPEGMQTSAEAQTPEETQTPAEAGTREMSRRLSRKVSLEVNRKVSLLKVSLLKVSRKPTQEILQDLIYCQPPNQNIYY